MSAEDIKETGIKRKKGLSSSSLDTSDVIDYKKAKQLLSISTDSGELEDSIYTDTEVEGELPESSNMAQQQDKEEGNLLDKLDDILKVRLGEMKLEMVQEIKTTLQENVERIEGKMFDLEQKNDNLEKELKLQISKQKENEDTIKQLSAKCKTLESRMVDIEQYSRRENIKIFGLVENDGEDLKQKVVKLIQDQMKVQTFQESDIQVVHRLNTKSEASMVNGARPVIVKLRSRDMKTTVMKARRNLKGSSIFVNDHLCKEVNALFNRVRRHRLVESAWSWDGVIFIKDKEGSTHRINFGQTVEDLLHD